MSYSFKDYIDYVIDPSNRLTIEEFDLLSYVKSKTHTIYTRVYLNPVTNGVEGYSRNAPINNPNISDIFHNEADYMFGIRTRPTSILFRVFNNQEMLLKYINNATDNSIMFDIDGNILYTNLDDFPKINILEIDEEMDLYLTLKYLNN